MELWVAAGRDGVTARLAGRVREACGSYSNGRDSQTGRGWLMLV
jgi:hypothetical protein